ncbi:MAG: cell division protein FtsA [Bacteroidaceae bacterium]|nr:cell division protein FtsA [Bacteroidaceae bacterium]
MGEFEPIIVTIEIGSSKIAGVAGKMKDGTMQIIAYAEDQTHDCVKRGVVYNIEKTTLCIKNVVSRLETTMKHKVSRIYVGLGGQSLHSEFRLVQSNLQTPTCINQAHIDAVTAESREVLRDDYQLVESFPQDFIVDSNVTSDPVGIVGTNLEGRFLNVIANSKLINNITTCFDNTDIDIIGFKVSAHELAKNVLTETEKRSGCALIDFGAGTTTVVVFKNNIVRLVSTIPLGFNNIIQDLCSLQIEYSEAKELLMKYGDAVPGDNPSEDDESEGDYVTTDGRNFEIAKIQFIIEARLTEILANVRTQISRSDYSENLLGGIVLTGGGANLKNLERAVMRNTNIDKVRVARKLVEPIIKNSTLTNLSLDKCTTNTVVSLLLSGTDNCVSGEIGDPDMFVRQQTDNDISTKKANATSVQKEEDAALATLEGYKGKLRELIVQIQDTTEDVTEHKANKHVRNDAKELINESNSLLGAEYEQATRTLMGKDKYKQSLREAESLIVKRDDEIKKLEDTVRQAEKETGIITRLTAWIDDLLTEKD